MSIHFGDQQAYHQWQAEQARELSDESGIEPIEAPTHQLDPETVRQLVFLILPPVPHHGKDQRLITAFKRFLVLAMLIDDHLASRGLDHIARVLTEIGLQTTRASLSQMHVALADITGIHRLGRSDAGREAYRQRAKRVWQNKKSTAKS